MSSWRIPLSDLDFGPDEEQAVLRVLRSKWLSMGPEVQAFERDFCNYVGVKHAFAVSNGTAALHIAYMALGLGPGHEVIQPAINFVAAANMTVAVGATPVFADIIGLQEPTFDPDELERCLTPQTKAVVVMHYGGYLCRMGEIHAICQRHRIPIIEDACHAVGARYLDIRSSKLHGLSAGAIGDIAAFSFFSNKNLPTGEGGMITTSRDDLAERIQRLRSHGMTTLTWDRHKGHASAYDVVLNGYNYRFNEIGAALGQCQLAKLKKNNLRRGELVRHYRSQLRNLAGWSVPFCDYQGDSAYHLMTVLAPSEEVRLQVAKKVNQSAIQISRHYPSVPMLSAFSAFRSPDLQRSETFAQRIISLPLYPTMTIEQVEEICQSLMEAQA